MCAGSFYQDSIFDDTLVLLFFFPTQTVVDEIMKRVQVGWSLGLGMELW